MYGLRGLGASSSDLAQAIARFEGFFQPGSIAQRDNNPGNLRAGPGSVGTDASGFAIFPDATTGWAALQHQTDLNVSRGLSLSEFFGGKQGVYPGYAPSGDANNPGAYSSTVAGWLGIDPNTPLSAALGSGTGSNSLSAALGSETGSTPLDSSSVDASGLSVDTSGSGMSGAALAGIGIAALALLWWVVD